MFNWDEFKNEKVAIHCDTEEKAREFIKECHERGMKWFFSTVNETEWSKYKESTCYSYSLNSEGLKFGHKSKFEAVDYKIIKWESEKMKFKVGDKVILATNEDWENGIEYRIVTKVLKNGYKLSDGELTWYDKELKLYEEPTEFTFQELISRNIPGVYVNCNDDMARVQSIEINEYGDLTINADFTGLKEINLGLGIYNQLKFKLQEPKKMYVLYGIEHQENGKIYFFRSRQNRVILDTALVICDTSKGKSYGRAVQRIEKELTESEYKQYKECWRA